MAVKYSTKHILMEDYLTYSEGRLCIYIYFLTQGVVLIYRYTYISGNKSSSVYTIDM